MFFLKKPSLVFLHVITSVILLYFEHIDVLSSKLGNSVVQMHIVRSGSGPGCQSGYRSGDL